ncbi:MFS transporter [Acinetobacter sp. MD2(2019)]|uniref:MFS transporter n=1 Tax=Acinetobacter sp. MD2(2019) TaxID=2605273 RepID=UPI002D1F3C3C|nr:MFS transporter [Acinetobacter sp. MD2(2019)]MEB3754194.1 MFS transporter [Acinetobacter sp. MD2(2019)]
MQALPIQVKLSGFYFFYYSIIGVFMPFWNLYLQHQGLNFQQIGILSSIAILTRFFAPLTWGWIADKTGKRMLLIKIATCVETCIWFAIFIIPNNFQLIAFLMFVFSFFQNAILAQFEGVTLFWLGDKKAQLYGRIRKWGSIGFIFAVFGIGKLLDLFSIQYLPILLLLISFFTFAWSFLIQEPIAAPKAQQHLESLLPILKQKHVAAFFSIELILLFSFAPFYSFYSNYMHQQHYSTSLIGMFWAFGVIAEIIMFAYASKVMQRFTWRQLVSCCLILTALRWFLVGTFPQLLVLQFMAQAIHAFSFGLFHFMAMRLISQSFSAQQQGRGQAVYSTIWGIGVASGSLLAGHYWQLLSGQTIFVVAGICVLCALPFLYWLPANNVNEALH